METKNETNEFIDVNILNESKNKKLKKPKNKSKNKKPKNNICDVVIEEEMEIEKVETEPINVIINKGTGAGGANTNINGLSYEDKTNLETLFSEVNVDKKIGTKTIKFINYENVELINANKSKLYKHLEKNGDRNITIQQAAGCKEPDEAYIDMSRKIIFIIEKKFQQTPGSVDEKIQTGVFKKIHYSKQFPNYKINYIYCLSDWFRRNEYNSVLEYLQENNIIIFWGNDINYKNNIIKFMCS
jgi:hypothetical protein